MDDMNDIADAMTEEDYHRIFLSIVQFELTKCLSELQLLEHKLIEDGKVGQPEEYSPWQKIFIKTVIDILGASQIEEEKND
jgi:hypothetical protein